MQLPPYLKPTAAGLLLSLKVLPRASRNEIGTALGSELRIKLTAPPVDSAANEALVRLLAQNLDLPRSGVELVRGHASRHKIVRIRGLDAEEVIRRLDRT